jgi:hypothetical protein
MQTGTEHDEVESVEPTTTGTSGEDYALKVVLVYQDDQTRQWAKEVYNRVRQLVGDDCLHTTWWNIRDLNQPSVLAGAVSNTRQSDVIVVAIRSTAGLPLAFYHWTDSWLDHRPGKPGALVALVGQPQAESDSTRDYLRNLSRRGRLDFMVQERTWSATHSSLEPESNHGASAPTGALTRNAAASDAEPSRRHRRIYE